VSANHKESKKEVRDEIWPEPIKDLVGKNPQSLRKVSYLLATDGSSPKGKNIASRPGNNAGEPGPGNSQRPLGQPPSPEKKKSHRGGGGGGGGGGLSGPGGGSSLLSNRRVL